MANAHFPLTERLTAVERVQLESGGLDPDDYFAVTLIPHNLQAAPQDGYLIVQGVFTSPLPVVDHKPLVLGPAGQVADASMLAAVNARVLMKRSTSCLPSTDLRSVFMLTCAVTDEAYAPLLDDVRKMVPLTSTMLNPTTVAFFALTYNELGMTSYRLQHLGFDGILHVESAATAVTLAWIAEEAPHALDDMRQCVMFQGEAEQTAVWARVLAMAPGISQARVRAMAEARGLDLPRLATEEPAAPFGALEDAHPPTSGLDALLRSWMDR